MSLYDEKYVNEANKEILEMASNYDNYSKFSFDIVGDFNKIPVRELCKNLSRDDFESREYLTRLCIIEKVVKISLDNKEVGSFKMNNLTDIWDAFEVFEKYPTSLNALMDVCISYLSKKSLLPLKETANQMEAPATLQLPT